MSVNYYYSSYGKNTCACRNTICDKLYVFACLSCCYFAVFFPVMGRFAADHTMPPILAFHERHGKKMDNRQTLDASRGDASGVGGRTLAFKSVARAPAIARRVGWVILRLSVAARFCSGWSRSWSIVAGIAC